MWRPVINNKHIYVLCTMYIDTATDHFVTMFPRERTCVSISSKLISLNDWRPQRQAISTYIRIYVCCLLFRKMKLPHCPTILAPSEWPSIYLFVLINIWGNIQQHPQHGMQNYSKEQQASFLTSAFGLCIAPRQNYYAYILHVDQERILLSVHSNVLKG